MPPNNTPSSAPNPSAPSGGQFDSSQFDFIMNPQTPPKKSLIPGGPAMQKIIFIAGGATLALILVIIIFSLFTKSDPNLEQVVKITQEQNEIVRIASVGNRQAGGDETKQLAALTASTVQTDQNQTVAYLAKQNRKVKSKELSATASIKTDGELKDAEQNGRFDEVFKATLLQLLVSYQSDLRTTSGNLGQNGKAVFGQNYNNVTVILNKYQEPTDTN